MEWKKDTKIIITLILLQGIIDYIYVFLYPTVNPIRATLIGTTAFVFLSIPQLKKFIGWNPKWAFIPIFANAFIGALSVQAGIVQSKSMESAVLHVGILIITYFIVRKIKK